MVGAAAMIAAAVIAGIVNAWVVGEIAHLIPDQAVPAALKALHCALSQKGARPNRRAGWCGGADRLSGDGGKVGCGLTTIMIVGFIAPCQKR